MGIIPQLTPEQTQNLLQHNYQLQQQLDMQHRIGVILGFMVFKALGYVERNVLTMPDYPAFNIKQQLITSIDQVEIDALQNLFPGDSPILGFQQSVIEGANRLVMSMVPESYANNGVSPEAAARPN